MRFLENPIGLWGNAHILLVATEYPINNKEYGCLHSRILRIRPSRVKNMPVVVDLKSPNCSGFFCIEMQYIKCNVQLYMHNQEHLYVHMHMYGMHFLKPHILCFEKYALILCMYSKRECQLWTCYLLGTTKTSEFYSVQLYARYLAMRNSFISASEYNG